MRRVYVTKVTMFISDPTLPVDLYLNVSNFAAGCYITQVQNVKAQLLVYNSFILQPAEHNYDRYKHELVAIVKFTKKYFHMLNAKYESVIHIDHKLLIEFLNAK